MRFVFDPRVAPGAKILGALAIAYAIFPFDLIPDLVPILGWLDDAGILAVGLYLLLRAFGRYQASVGAASPPPLHGRERGTVPGDLVESVGVDVSSE